MKKPAIILCSGGVDSTTCLAYAKSKGFDCYALSFNYGQKHHAELKAVKRIAEHYGVQSIIVDLPIGQIGGSALTDKNLDVPDFNGSTEIPLTYVPARNTIFLSFALGFAEVLKAKDIFIGSSFVDYSGYPDCRPDYFKAFEVVANLATKIGIEEGGTTIHTPILYLSKAETIKLGLQLGVDYRETVSCYKADDEGRACGRCDSCALRKKGFLEAGLADPTRYNNL
jgi:7-cyano-7-deazaguanine synthase